MRELMWFVKAAGRSVRRDDRGATMLEYGLVATLIAVVAAKLVMRPSVGVRPGPVNAPEGKDPERNKVASLAVEASALPRGPYRQPYLAQDPLSISGRARRRAAGVPMAGAA